MCLEREPAETPAAAAGPTERHRQDRRPVCPDHQRQMVSYSSQATFTYYRCPVDDCPRRDKRLRPDGTGTATP